MKILRIILFCCLIASGLALECYVCTDQEHNTEKCLNTIKTCEQEEDMCLTEVKWGSTPYWDQGAAKQYYVSKRCSTKAICDEKKTMYLPYCTFIWYEDWRCSECCQGDRCNYYVFLSGSTARSSIITIAITVFAALTFWRILFV